MRRFAYLETVYLHASHDALRASLCRRFGSEANAVFDVERTNWSGHIAEGIIRWAKDIFLVASVGGTEAIASFLSSLSKEELENYFYAGNQYERSIWLQDHYPEAFNHLVKAIHFSEIENATCILPSTLFAMPDSAVYFQSASRLEEFKQALSEVLLTPADTITVREECFEYVDPLQGDTQSVWHWIVRYIKPPVVVTLVEDRFTQDGVGAIPVFVHLLFNQTVGRLEVSAAGTMLREKLAECVSQHLLFSESPDSWESFRFEYRQFSHNAHFDIANELFSKAKVIQMTLMKNGRALEINVSPLDSKDVYYCLQDIRAVETYTISKITLAITLNINGESSLVPVTMESGKILTIQTQRLIERCAVYTLLERWNIVRQGRCDQCPK
ncbi:hypothetical protein [Teredinibacter sp. KSP-S5-2]|uniref:hypothetical protein n=1 Tax=Teredinibacter sp. KSP-S5-2 TaxID=3034506 RepID=UPI00293442CF|nr:hypothetical protein [Teredinibacter sp. KSP-S5-2]WNO10510.1 hypothetical protein P5V12_04925 [Teredinibacter sp. KSP-S5-2]